MQKILSWFRRSRVAKAVVLFITCLLLLIAGNAYYAYREKDITNVSRNNSSECENINIETIRGKAQAIESNIISYEVVSKDIMDKSTEGGQQTNYTANGKTVLIKQTFYGETGKSEVSYYLENEKLFYFTQKNTEYTLPISQDSSGNVKSFTVKDFYLGSNINLCSWYSNQKLQIIDQDTQDLVTSLISGL